MPQKGHHDIYIRQVDSEYRVRPAWWSFSGKAGSTMKFRNLTNKEVLVALPKEILKNPGHATFTLKPARQHPLRGRAGDDVKSVPLIKARAGDPAHLYPYSVIVRDRGMHLAVGESEPVVIVDPPPA